MISNIKIKNFKSIVNESFDLGTLNVFIGANGAGKSNILEAIGFVAAKSEGEISLNSLSSAGIRIARPDLIVNSFYDIAQKKVIEIEITNGSYSELYKISTKDKTFAYTPWKVDTTSTVLKTTDSDAIEELVDSVSRYEIYTPEIEALRGFTQTMPRYPLGLHGEGFDMILNSLQPEQREEAARIANKYIDWLDRVAFTDDETAKNKFLKLGRSKSHLYFSDRYMLKKNSCFSAENANDGALVVLFYLTLIMSDRTPRFFAIDNFDMRLNPKLCRYLVGNIYSYAKKYGKQVIITTHNPAVLDGLNLNDDAQYLYVVKRTDRGYTKTERITVKPKTDHRTKLSELWMNGIIGGVPSISNHYFTHEDRNNSRRTR